MTDTVSPDTIGMPLQRLDGHAKVTGTATYAFEHRLQRPTYLHPIQATIARGRVSRMDITDAAAVDGVVAVLTPDNSPALTDTSDRELAVLQSREVAFRGQFIGAVVAETPEIARHAAGVVRVGYDQREHDTVLTADRADLYTPDQVNPTFATDTAEGDVDTEMAAAPVRLDETYTTPMEHNNPMEPHTSVAVWNDDQAQRLLLYDSTQGAHSVRDTLAPVFGLQADQMRVLAPHVGGGFGSKGMPHAHNVLAVLAAQRAGGRPVKFALTRQQMFSVAGHRTPTIQRIRLAADTDGRLRALTHDTVEHTATIKEFAEQTSVPSRMMYAVANRATSHRLAALDVGVPSWMRAPGEAPGMVAPEIAMDELAEACGLDPIELRARNEPEFDPETGKPWSGRELIQCLREGARRFGWQDRPSVPGTRIEDRWQVGCGVAASTYPSFAMPGSVAEIEYAGGRYSVRIGATDIGTGTRTALTQIAADALGCPAENVDLEIADTDLPNGTVEGGSSGINSWGSTLVAAARAFLDEHGRAPTAGASSRAEFPDNPDVAEYAIHSFGAQFAEARVNLDTGEVRVPRMLGVFSVGRVINPRTARSQFIGGMTMGLSMALHEHSEFDHNTGHVINHDFAEYHIPTNADVGEIEATWLGEPDTHANPMGAKGIGEIGIVGSPAAVVNAIYNACGIRVRDLPITPDKLVR